MFSNSGSAHVQQFSGAREILHARRRLEYSQPVQRWYAAFHIALSC